MRRLLFYILCLVLSFNLTCTEQPEDNSSASETDVEDPVDPGPVVCTDMAAHLASGSGTALDPYLISDECQLFSLAQDSANFDKEYKQTADLDFDGFYDLNAQFMIGTCGTGICNDNDGAETEFIGVYDGDGHSIKNFAYADVAAIGVGLFSSLQNIAEIRDLTIEDFTVTGNDLVGALAGWAAVSTIQNVTANDVTVTGVTEVGGVLGASAISVIDSVTVDGAVVTATGGNYGGGLTSSGHTLTITNVALTNTTVSVTGSYAGGLIGYLNDTFAANTVSDCHFSGTVTATAAYVGGLLGHFGAITYVNVFSQSSADAVVTGTTNTGGLVGNIFADVALTVDDVDSSGTVNGATSTGGLIGNATASNSLNTYLNLSDAHSTADVTGTTNVGGLIGNLLNLNGYVLDNLSATGDVNGATQVGGLIGNYTSLGSLNNGSATGNVTASGNLAGGLIGFSSAGTVTKCTATGNVSGATSVGGAFGRNSSAVSKCSATGDVNGVQNVGGFVGYQTGNANSATNCFATGNVTATGAFVGGFVGLEERASVLSRSYSTGNVAGTLSVGGFVGRMVHIGVNFPTINNSFSTGTIVGAGVNANVGNFVGTRSSAINNVITNGYFSTNQTCDANGDTVPGDCNSNGSTGAAAATFQNSTTNPPLNNWDFTTIWQSMAADYPQLQ